MLCYTERGQGLHCYFFQTDKESLLKSLVLISNPIFQHWQKEIKALAFDVSFELITPDKSLIGPIFVVDRFPSKDLTVYQKSLAEIVSLGFDSQ